MTHRRVRLIGGELWLGSDADVDAAEWTRGDYRAGEVDAMTLMGRGPGAPTRLATLRQAVQVGSGDGTYFMYLGASLRPGPAGQLRVEVVTSAGQGGLARGLVVPVRNGALAGASTSDIAGVLRFERAQVHEVDCDPARYRQGAWVLAALLGRADLDAAGDDELAALAELLWRGAV